MQLDTPRLLLRRWHAEDLAPFAAINADPRVRAFLGPPQTLAETAAAIARIEAHFDRHGFGLHAAELKETGEMIGFIGLSVPAFDAPFTPCVEIGWRLAAAQWGKGLATEGARAVLQDGFSRLGLPEILSFTAILNHRSMSVMKRLGMTTNPRENFDHPKLAKDNPLCPHVLYRLTKENHVETHHP